MTGAWSLRVTRWNQHGIRWRELSAAELMWLTYTETLEYLKHESPGQVRRFLTNMRDWDELRAWDNQQMRDRASDGGVGDAYSG